MQLFNYIHFKDTTKPKIKSLICTTTAGRIGYLDCTDLTPASIEALNQWDRQTPIKLWCGFNGIDWRGIHRWVRTSTVEKVTGRVVEPPIVVKRFKPSPRSGYLIRV